MSLYFLTCLCFLPCCGSVEVGRHSAGYTFRDISFVVYHDLIKTPRIFLSLSLHPNHHLITLLLFFVCVCLYDYSLLNCVWILTSIIRTNIAQIVNCLFYSKNYFYFEDFPENTLAVKTVTACCGSIEPVMPNADSPVCII